MAGPVDMLVAYVPERLADTVGVQPDGTLRNGSE